MRRAALVITVSALGVLVGGYSLAVAHDEPAYSFAGSSAAGGIALLAAGWSLLTAGVAWWLRRPGSVVGPLLAGAGLAWLLLEWNNPGIGSPLAFTIGMASYASCPPLVAHALLAYPSGRVSRRAGRAILSLAYTTSVVVSGILPSLFFDPQTQGCGGCPRNLLQLRDSASDVADLERLGVRLGVVWTLAATLLLVWNVARASPASRRGAGAVMVAGSAYLGLVGATYAASLDRGFLTNGQLERRLWLAQAVCLVAIAATTGWAWVRARRARLQVARLVVQLAESPAPGGLRDVLARIARDPGLVLAYPVDETGRLVDAGGQPVAIGDDRQRTSLVRDGRLVAVLAHAPGVLDDDQLVDEVTDAARLALENERLQAEVQARLAELRASRARIVETGDAERKRLERDLHDGAQQRLVGLSLSLRLLRSQLGADVEASAAAKLEEAETELRTAVAELRELAHGIFPAVLADEGLAAAIEALAEEARVPVRIESVPEERFAPAIETAAYTAVAEASRAAGGSVTVRARVRDRTLVVELEADDSGGGLDLVAIGDRVGAVGGSVATERRSTGVFTIRAELPCGS